MVIYISLFSLSRRLLMILRPADACIANPPQIHPSPRYLLISLTHAMRILLVTALDMVFRVAVMAERGTRYTMPMRM